jgi:hypothetical protein
MGREKIIASYLAAAENCLQAFGFKIIPRVDDVAVITLHTKEFITALKELYFSENKNKEEYYEVIFKSISKAHYYICIENFESGYSDTWRAIDSSLSTAYSYISELMFRETNKYFPFPSEAIEQPLLQSKKQKSNQLQTKLTISQCGKLCDLLIKFGFTPETTDREGFIWAFGGVNENYDSFSIDWLRKKKSSCLFD